MLHPSKDSNFKHHTFEMPQSVRLSVIKWVGPIQDCSCYLANVTAAIDE